jgi:hypothetical protein
MLRAVIVKFADPTLLITSDIDDIARLAGAIAKMDFWFFAKLRSNRSLRWHRSL